MRRFATILIKYPLSLLARFFKPRILALDCSLLRWTSVILMALNAQQITNLAAKSVSPERNGQILQNTLFKKLKCPNALVFRCALKRVIIKEGFESVAEFYRYMYIYMVIVSAQQSCASKTAKACSETVLRCSWDKMSMRRSLQV